MNRLALAVAAAAVLLTGGCGGSPQPSSSTGTSRSTAPAAANSPASTGTTGTVTVSQKGKAPANTLWYLRIEDMTAKPVLERAYPGQPISASQSLAPGRYRVIVWHRPCSGACPTEGEDGLGPLAQVCGAQVDLKPGVKQQTTAEIASDGGCTVKVAR